MSPNGKGISRCLVRPSRRYIIYDDLREEDQDNYRMITEELVEKALEFIRTEASNHASAKASRIQIEQFRKSKKGMLIGECEEKTMAAKEAWAYAHPDYIELLDGLQAAVESEETILWKMRAAQLTVEVYRTQQANARFIDKAHT